MITNPEGWTVIGALTLGESIGWSPENVSITIYADDAGRPGVPVCEYPELASFVEEGGDLVITFPSPCVLGPGHWWLGQQVGLYSYFGYHYWTIRMIQSYHEAVWRNPGDLFGTGCVDWTPQTVCGWEGPDLLFQIRREAPDPTPVPTVTTWGAIFLVLAIGTLSVYILGRSVGSSSSG